MWYGGEDGVSWGFSEGWLECVDIVDGMKRDIVGGLAHQQANMP